MKRILVLPTGEWAELNQDNQAAVIGLSEEQLNKITTLNPSASAMKTLMIAETDINAWFAELES